jgi:signal transduction histidine kinase
VRAGRRFWAVYALIWALAVPAHAFVLSRQAPVSAAEAVMSAVSTVGIAALLGVLVWSVTARLPLATGRRLRFAAAHGVLALAYGALWFGIQYLLLRLAAGPQIAAMVARASGLWTVLYGMFIYGAVASAFYAVRSQHALRLQQTAAAQAQLVALRAQLNPHFLFNALHSVAALVRHDPRAAEAALDRLGDLLRYALDEGAGETVHLADEWAFASDYLELEKLRLGDRLHLVASFDDEALDCRVPPFVLQPLVENAVRHGIAVRPEGGSLTVEARRRDDRLAIRVEDDGPGADPAAVEHASGLGLKGVRRQVDARYGGLGSVAVATGPGRGFRVDVEIPA